MVIDKIVNDIPTYDPSTRVDIVPNVNYTFTDDSYFSCFVMDTSSHDWSLDGVNIASKDNLTISGTTLHIAIAFGYAKKGQVLTGYGRASIYKVKK